MIKDGDQIHINLTKRTLDLLVSDEEMEKRRQELPPFEPKVKSGYLARYQALVTSADTGGVMVGYDVLSKVSNLKNE